MNNNYNSGNRGIRKLSTFLTADALLAMIILVWAQFWLSTLLRSEPEPPQGWSLGIGLAWSYTSVLALMIALGWAGLTSLARNNTVEGDRTPDLSIALFISALVMGIFTVGQSILLVLAKALSGMDILGIVPPVVSKLPVGIVLFAAFVCIIWTSICKIKKKDYLTWMRIMVLLVLIILLFIIGMSANALSGVSYDVEDEYCRFFTCMIAISIVLLLSFSVFGYRLLKNRRLINRLT